MCRVLHCTEKHDRHYCKICQNKNSDHFSRKCPEGVCLYHGTKVEFIQSIMKTGLRLSSDGRLGKGLYLASKSHAVSVAKHREGKGIAVVFEVLVNESKCLKSMHPPWAGIKTEFKEWCMNGSNYQVLRFFAIVEDCLEIQCNLQVHAKKDIKYQIRKQELKIITSQENDYCALGHPLKNGSLFIRRAICDVCNKKIMDSNYFCCVPCDYDICDSCKKSKDKIEKGNPSSLFCPLSHLLQDGNSGYCLRNVQCDCCKKDVPDKSFYYCSRCNYDICYKCATQQKVNVTKQKNAPSYLQCPKNHQLSDQHTAKSSRNCICDKCQKEPIGENFYFCADCDYDICYRCAGKNENKFRIRQKKSVLKCPKNHLLKNGNSGICTRRPICDRCMVFQTKKDFYYCQACDYDLCYQCAGIK